MMQVHYNAGFQQRIRDLEEDVALLRAALVAAKIEHYENGDDPYYTCRAKEWDDDQALIAKGEGPFLDWPKGATRPDCTCGADAHNAAIDRALKGEG